MKKLNMLLIGGTGFIGRTLTDALHDAGHDLMVISRRPPGPIWPKTITFLQADVSVPGPWQDIVPDFDVVINLVGLSIFRRWTARNKQKILDSRIIPTRNIVDSLSQRTGKTRLFFSPSGVGYYGYHGDEVLTEDAPAGIDFLARVAARWEEEAGRVSELGIRPVFLRVGHVLGRRGGVLTRLLALAKLHLTGRWGNGEQWVSWIHEKDLAGIFLFLLDRSSVSGPVNACSPHPVRNREMMQLLARIYRRRSFIPHVPEFMLKFMTGEFASVFLNGQRAVPEKLLDAGFTFEYPDYRTAIEGLIRAQPKKSF